MLGEKYSIAAEAPHRDGLGLLVTTMRGYVLPSVHNAEESVKECENEIYAFLSILLSTLVHCISGAKSVYPVRTRMINDVHD